MPTAGDIRPLHIIISQAYLTNATFVPMFPPGRWRPPLASASLGEADKNFSHVQIALTCGNASTTFQVTGEN